MAIISRSEQPRARIIGRASRRRLHKLHLQDQAYFICLGNAAVAVPVQSCCENNRGASYQQEPPYHVVFKYLNPLLLAIIAIRCQALAMDPLATHPIYMWIFITTVVIYYLLLGKINEMNANDQHLATHQYQFVCNFFLVNGALSSVALTSVLLPRLLGWLMFVAWGFLAIIVSRHFFILIYEKSVSYAVGKYQYCSYWIMYHFSEKPGMLPN